MPYTNVTHITKKICNSIQVDNTSMNNKTESVKGVGCLFLPALGPPKLSSEMDSDAILQVKS